MSYTDIIGTAGVGLILAAYFLQVFNYISSSSTFFFGLNIAGAGLACYASFLIHYWPFVLLEGTWCLVSVIGFVRKINKK
jgi:hypothetical protein